MRLNVCMVHAFLVMPSVIVVLTVSTVPMRQHHDVQPKPSTNYADPVNRTSSSVTMVEMGIIELFSQKNLRLCMKFIIRFIFVFVFDT